MASAYGMLGSVDSNTGDPLLGWDTDQFPMNLQDTAAIMGVVIRQGGFGATGGLNFDAKVRRESVDPVDLFYGHVRGCLAAAFLWRALSLLQILSLNIVFSDRPLLCMFLL